MAATDVSYVPGALTAVAGDHCWALVETSPNSRAVASVWRQLSQGAAPDALLAGLIAGGIEGTAGFALLVQGSGGRYRLFCRGAVGATVVRVAGNVGGAPGARQAAIEQIEGTGLLTWREQVVDGADRIFLGSPPADTALRLPATSGVLLADCVIIDLTNAASRDTVSYEQDAPGPQPPSQPPSSQQEPGQRKKSIVFFPETITMTHPGSLAERASAASLPVGQQAPAGQQSLGQQQSFGQQLPDDRGAVPPVTPTPLPAGAAGNPAPTGGHGAPAPQGPAAAQERSSHPGSGAPPAPGLPTAGGQSGPFGGLAAVGVPGAPGYPDDAPARADGRPGDEASWGGPGGTVVDCSIRPNGDGGPGPLAPGAAPVTAGYPGAGGQPPAQYQGPSQPRQPLPDAAWSDSAYPGGMPPTSPSSNPLNHPTNNGVPGGLIDAPPWLSSPNGPGAAAQPASQALSTGMPTGQVPLGQPPAGPVPGSSAPTGPSPSMGGPVEPRYPSPRPELGRGESESTVKRGELPEIVSVTTPPDRIGPVVPALICPSGHVNPPSGATCRRCGAPLPHDPVPVPRPVLGVLRLSFGDVISLDRGVLMGRNPRTDFAGPDGFGGAGGEERPHVVKLPSADGDISRTHLRVTLDGWHVLVTDLNSTNGTLITLPGRDPQQLRPGEPVPIQPGTVVTLADGIDFRYEVTE
jgi:hypothetical protein